MGKQRKYIVTPQLIADFNTTLDAKPNLTPSEILQKFPELNNDTDFLQSMADYRATIKSGKYKNEEEIRVKFPEFQFDVKKKDLSQSGSPSGFAPSQGIKQGTAPFIKPQTVSTKVPEPMPVEQRYKAQPEPKSFGEQALSAFEAGANTFNANLAATPGFIYDLAGAPFRVVGLDVPKFKDTGKGAAIINSYIENQIGNAEQLKKDSQINPEVQKGIVENVKNGNYANAFKSAGLRIAESLPAMIGMGLTGGMGAGGIVATQTKMALPFMSGKWQEIAEDPTMSEPAKIINAIITGYSETIFEDKFGSLGLIKQAKKILAEQGEKAAEDFIKKGFKETAEEAAKKYFPITAPISNALEEGATRYMQNFTKLVTGENPDQDLLEGVDEAMAQGGAFGAGIGAITSVAKYKNPALVKKAVASGNTEVVDAIKTKLQEQLANEQITQEEFDATNEYINNTEDINTKIPANIPVEQRERMIDITADRNLLMAEQANLEQELEATDIAFKPRVQARIDDIQEQVNVFNDAILGLESPITYRQTEKGFERVDGAQVDEISEKQYNYAKETKPEGIIFEESAPVTSAVTEGSGAVTEAQQPESVAGTETLPNTDTLTEAEQNELADIETALQNPDITEEEQITLNNRKNAIEKRIEPEGNLSEYQGTQEGQPQIGESQGSVGETTQPQTDNSDSTIASEGQKKISTGIYTSKPSNDLMGGTKYYRQKDIFSEPEEISEQEYNLDTGTTPVYNDDGTPIFDNLINSSDTGLNEEQFNIVAQKFFDRLNTNGNPVSAAQSAYIAARAFNNRLTESQKEAIQVALRPLVAQYKSEDRVMLNPSLGQVQKNQEDQVKSYENRRLKWWDRMMETFFEQEQIVIKDIRNFFDGKGKLAEAAFKNISRYSGAAAPMIKSIANSIWTGLSKKMNYTLDNGRKASERYLFDMYLQMGRIKEINRMMQEKFDRLVKLNDDIKYNNKLTKEERSDAKKEFSDIQKYLSKRNVLGIKPDGFFLKPYNAGNSIDPAKADKNILDIKNIVGEDKFADFERRQQIYADSYRLIIAKLLSEGIISEDQYNAMAKYDYAPTMHLDKLIDEELSRSKTSSTRGAGSGLKDLKGGSETALSEAYDVQLIEDINRTFRKSFVNRAAKILMQEAKSNPDNGLVEMAKPLFDPVTKELKYDSKGNLVYPPAPSGFEYIPVFENGKKYQIQAPSEFAEMFKYGQSPILDLKQTDWVRYFNLALGVKIMRNLITGINPAFGVYQMIVDAPQALIATDAFSKSFTIGAGQLLKEVNSVKSDVISEKGWFSKAQDAGAFTDMTTSESSRVEKSKNIWGETKGIDKNLWEKLVNKGEEFNQKFEYLTRTAIFKRKYEQLSKEFPKMSDEDKSTLAANESAKMVDYSRGGSLIKMLSNFIPYLNASFQVFKSSVGGYKNDPAKYGVHAVEMIGLSTIALALTMGKMGGEDDEEEFLAVPEKVRNENILIRNRFSDNPDLKWIKVPIPRLLQPVHVATQELLLDAWGIKEGEPSNVAKAVSEIQPARFSSITATPMVSSYIKYALNKDAYTGREIVRDEENIWDYFEGQDDERVSDIYKSLAKASTLVSEEGISAPRLQAVAESYGIKETNPFVSAPKAILEAGLAFAQDKPIKMVESIKEGGLIEEVFNMSGFKKRIFQKDPKFNQEFEEQLLKRIKDKNVEKKQERSKYEAQYKKNQSEDDLISFIESENPDMDMSEVDNIVKPIINKKLLSTRPNWYSDLIYASSIDDKKFILDYFTRKMTQSQKNKVIEDLQENFVSPSSKLWEDLE